MSANFLPLFHDCLQSGYVFNPNGKPKENLREETKIFNYVKSIRLQVDNAVPKLEPTEKNDFFLMLYWLYRDTEIIYFKAHQIKTILAKSRWSNDVIRFIYFVALRLTCSPLIQNPHFWDYLIQRAQLKDVTTEIDNESFLVKIWADIISQLVLPYGDDYYSYPSKDVIYLIQGISTLHLFKDCLKALSYLKTTSSSPAIAPEYVKLVIQGADLSVSSALISALHGTLEQKPLAEAQKIKIIRRLLGKVNSLPFVEFFFSTLNDKWFVHIFGTEHDTYSFRLSQLEFIFLGNPGIFYKFDWERIMQSNPTFAFPAPETGLMVKKGGTFDSLVMLIYEILINYGLPSFFITKFLHKELSQQETKIFLFLIKGGNLTQSPDIPFKLTQRQAYLFSHFESELARQPFDKFFYQPDRYKSETIMGPDTIEIPNRFAKLTLIYALAWVKCLDELLGRYAKGKVLVPVRQQMAAHGHEMYLLKITLKRVMERYGEIQWIYVLPQFIYRNADIIQERHLDEVLDYINNHIIRNQIRVDFKTKSWPRLLDESNAWHLRISEARNIVLKKNIYPDSGIGKIQVLHRGEVYLVEQICNSFELHEEGLIMKHCVSSYDVQCSRGQTFIFSFRRFVNNSWERCLTIQVNLFMEFEIVQAKGWRNREPYKSEKAVLKLWKAEAIAQLKV